MNTKLVAVYGTLKQGYGNHHVMQADKGEFVSAGVTVLPFKMFGGWGFPRVVEEMNMDGNGVHVEVFECPDVQHMDSLEGHPHFFCRKEVEVVIDVTTEEDIALSGGMLQGSYEKVTAWMYFHPPTEGEVLESGCWTGGSY